MIMDHRSRQSSWRDAAVALGLVLAALAALYWSTVTAIVAAWSRDPLGHGYVIVPVAAYLIWDRRSRLKEVHPSTSFLALPFLALLTFVWLLGNLTDTKFIQQVSLVSLAIGAVWAILGTSAARVLLFPLGLLFFALPLGERFIPLLQDLTARFVVNLLTLSHVPVLLEGHVISIPGGSWKVAEACSGINYLTASLTIGYIFAGTSYRRWRHRIGFVAGSAIVPLIANALRVYGTILVASVAGASAIAGTKHYLFGWLVFATMTGLLFATCGRWREDDRTESASHAQSRPRSTPIWSTALVTCLAVLVAALGPLAAAPYVSGRNGGSSILASPTASLPWRIADANPFAWAPRFQSPRAEFVRTYQSEGRFVTMFVAYYSTDRVDGKLAGTSNVWFPDPWWPRGRERRTVMIGAHPINVRETMIEGPSSSSLLVWNWYCVDDQCTDNDYLAQAYLAKARLLRRSRESLAVALATDNRPGLEPAAVLQDFLHHLSLTTTSRSDRYASDEWPARLRP